MAQANTTQVLHSGPSTSSQVSGQNSEWFVDSGATHHITSHLGNLNLASPYQGKSQLIVGNGSPVPIRNIGSMELPTLQKYKSVALNKVLHIPDITKNLLSISQFLKDNHAIIEFHADSCLIKDVETNRTLLKGQLKNGLYQLDLGSIDSRQEDYGGIVILLLVVKIRCNCGIIDWVTLVISLLHLYSEA